MTNPVTPATAPPWERLRAQLLACVEQRIARGDAAGGDELRVMVEAWWEDQQRWNQSLARLLGIHHEINNALVGVSGNAQLLLMGPAAGQPGVRERLDVVLREAQRIREVALQLRELRALIAPGGPALDAAGTPRREAA